MDTKADATGTADKALGVDADLIRLVLEIGLRGLESRLRRYQRLTLLSMKGTASRSAATNGM